MPGQKRTLKPTETEYTQPPRFSETLANVSVVFVQEGQHITISRETTRVGGKPTNSAIGKIHRRRTESLIDWLNGLEWQGELEV